MIYSVPKTYNIKSTPISSYDSLIFSLLGDIPSFEFFPSLSNLYIKCNDSWSNWIKRYEVRNSFFESLSNSPHNSILS